MTFEQMKKFRKLHNLKPQQQEPYVEPGDSYSLYYLYSRLTGELDESTLNYDPYCDVSDGDDYPYGYSREESI